MQSLSPAFRTLQVLAALLLACQVTLLGQACSMGSPSTSSQPRAPQATVYLAEVADWSFEAAHPVVIEEVTLKQILRGLYVSDHISSHNSSADGSKPMRAFSDEDVEYLAPLLAQALLQAQPEYVVAFRLSSSAGSGSEPTAGTVYVKDQDLYVTLTGYEGNPNGTDSSLSVQAAPHRGVSFVPESAGHRQKADPTVALGQRDLFSLAIDYRSLGKPSASDPAIREAIAVAAPAANTPEMKASQQILMASSAADTSMKAESAPPAETEATSRTEQELKDAQRTIARKDTKIDQLRRDLESMRQQLEAKDKELRQVKSKSAPIKRGKRGKAELVIR